MGLEPIGRLLAHEFSKLAHLTNSANFPSVAEGGSRTP